MYTFYNVQIDGKEDKEVSSFSIRGGDIIYIVRQKDQIRIRTYLNFWLYMEDTPRNKQAIQQFLSKVN